MLTVSVDPPPTHLAVSLLWFFVFLIPDNKHIYVLWNGFYTKKGNFLDDHLQEASPSGWSFARGWSLQMIICKRPNCSRFICKGKIDNIEIILTVTFKTLFLAKLHKHDGRQAPSQYQSSEITRDDADLALSLDFWQLWSSMKDVVFHHSLILFLIQSYSDQVCTCFTHRTEEERSRQSKI